MSTDHFLQVTLYFGTPGLIRGFLRTFPACHMTAVQGLIRCRMTELDTFVFYRTFRRSEKQM